MFKLSGRAVLIMVALAVAGFIATQIPQLGVTALAGNIYPTPTPKPKKKGTPTPTPTPSPTPRR